MARLSVGRLAVFAVLAVLVVGAHFLPGFSTSDLTGELRNGVHIVGFAAIAAILYSLLPAAAPVRALLTLLVVAVLGVVSEFVQSGFTGVDLYDVSRDLAGASVFLVAAFLWSWSAHVTRGATIIRGLSVIVGLAVFAPLIYWLVIFMAYARQFPVILDFEGPADHLIFESINANISITDSTEAGGGFDGQVLRVDLLRRGWSGILLKLPINDWSEYRFVSFRVAMIGDTRTRFDVHLTDGMHPGYRTQHLIGGDPAGPDPVTVRLPLREVNNIPGRPPLDPSRIFNMYIIGKDRRAGAIMYLDDIRLE